MRKKHGYIPMRRRIYCACEGRTEIEYVGWLQDIIDLTNKRSHLVRKDLHGSGNPVHMLRTAIQDRTRQRAFGEFHGSVLFFDSDTCHGKPEIFTQVNESAAKQNFLIIWQRPCGEAFLLRHIRRLQPGAEKSSRDARDNFRTVFGKDAPLERHELHHHLDNAGFNVLNEMAGVYREFAALLRLLDL